MKTFKELLGIAEAKATMCGRCGTVHVPPSQGGKCPALAKEELETVEESADGKKLVKGGSGTESDPHTAHTWVDIRDFGDHMHHLAKKSGKPVHYKFNSQHYKATPESKGFKIKSGTGEIVKEQQGVSEVWKGHSDTVKNPNFNDELSYRRVNPVGNRLKSGKLSADERGSQERLKSLMKYTQKKGGLAGPKGVLPEQGVVEGQDWSPGAKETMNKDKIASLKNLIASYKQKGNDAKVKELQAELKSMQEETLQSDTTQIVKEEVTTMNPMDRYIAAISNSSDFTSLDEKKLTPAEMKKREEVAKAIERENPDMPMAKKMAIATATAKKVAEDVEEVEEAKSHTVPKTEREKDLAAAAEPKDKITHKDVLVKRGVVREEELEEGADVEYHVVLRHPKEGKKVVRVSALTPSDAAEKAKSDYPDHKVDKIRDPQEKNYFRTEEVEEAFQRNMNPHNDLAGRGSRTSFNKTAAGKKREFDRGTELLKDKMKFTKSQGGVAGPKGKLPEEVELTQEEGNPTGVTIHWKDAKTGKSHWATHFTAKSAAAHEKELKAAGHTITQRKLEYAKEETDLTETYHDELSSRDPVTGKRPDGTTAGSFELLMQKAAIAHHAAVARTRASKEAQMKKKVDEEVEQTNEGMISYVDFTDKIYAHRRAGNAVIDHKYTDKKASYTVVDKEGTGRKVTHTPSGSKIENLGAVAGYEKDSEKAEVPTEKRGRGRPKGSTSGARRHK